MISKVHTAHVLWARTDMEFLDIVSTSGMVAGTIAIVTGSVEVFLYRLCSYFNKF